jgi:hypothetical protein
MIIIDEIVTIVYFDHSDIVRSHNRGLVRSEDFTREMLSTDAIKVFKESSIAIYTDYRGIKILIKSRW